MKTWEMVKELMENPEKKFALKSDDTVCLGCNDGVIDLSSIDYLLIVDEWKEVKEPVTFVEAVESGKSIKPASWRGERYLEIDDLVYELSQMNPSRIRALIADKWEIED